ncbi:hypothetical protein GcM3_180016 [Golovinomyces cichoracearum]|uniref:Uncharacterized protein n=1 Tax=Golovinomyces cichoracearum TaxID=62708 RepID=A0A420HMU3_9PEZI|nr:hypothetical protein GcM3_180016 [Golovinomyces cichoracearum]
MGDSNNSNDKYTVEDPIKKQKRLKTFVQEIIEKYKYPELRDNDLWKIYQDDFKVVSSQNITGLRNQLRRRGVLIQKGRGFHIAQKLYETLHQENPLEWSENEIKEQLATDRLLFDSRYNPNWENQNLIPPKQSPQSSSSLQEEADRAFCDQKDIRLKRYESDERKFKDNRELNHPPREQNSLMVNQMSVLYAGSIIAGPLIIQTMKESYTVENGKKTCKKRQIANTNNI